MRQIKRRVNKNSPLPQIPLVLVLHQWKIMSKPFKENLSPSGFSGSVKLHKFQPSGMVIWTMVGKKREHWVDAELGFCSCNRFFYRTLSNGQNCYHLTCVISARKTQKFTTIEFDDSEQKIFVDGLISDLKNSLLRSRHPD